MNFVESGGKNVEQLRVTLDKIINHTGAQCTRTNALSVGEPCQTTRESGVIRSRSIITTLKSEQDQNNILRLARKPKTRIYIQYDVCQKTSLENSEWKI